ncbi:MAG TPA: methyl-accepting chemotaxis protein [Albitalea sp.]|nr:methyl-accepting chemotaxis protein [Albitalea sp.]
MSIFRFQASIGRRLGLGFAALVGLLCAMAAVSGLGFNSIGKHLGQIIEVNNPKTDLAHQLLGEINEMAILTRSIALLTDLREIDKSVKAMGEAQVRYKKAEEALGSAISGPDATDDEKRLFTLIKASSAKAIPEIKEAVRHGSEGANVEAVMALTLRVAPAEAVWRKQVAELITHETSNNHAAFEMAEGVQKKTLRTALGVTALAVLLAVLLAWRITRSVTVPIGGAIQVAERIAEGDLSTTVPVHAQDEIGRLLQAIAAMQDRLRTLVGDIRQSAESISTASVEIATGNHDLSHRTEQQAASLQKTASSMDQLTGTVRHNADSARQADQLASSASEIAARGGSVVEQVVSTMADISTSSKKIADIIGVIDGIAFQTNILALNAAVEAARAGEQGRGFAVVAGEVRSLAQRSAEAAKEIKALISASGERVDSGAKLVSDAGSTMREIVASIQRVTDIMSEITASTSEQSSGIGHVSGEVNQLDQMTQQNAALVEQSAAATESLKEQAQRLAQAVRAFRLSGEEAASA